MAMNKALIAGLACAVGVCAFAAVEGNNTAVVIRKAAVTSTTGWQYLAVPVRGFDITGRGQVKGIALADVLPPSLYGTGTQLIVEDNETGDNYLANATYNWGTVSDAPAWVVDSMDVGTQLIAANARVWVKIPEEQVATDVANDLFSVAAATNTAAAAVPAETIFAGEQNTVEYLVSGTINGMTAFGNASSETVEFPAQALATMYTVEGNSTTQLVENPQVGDQLLRLGNNRKTYIYYSYVPQVGSTPARWVTATKFDGLGIAPNKIAPGEAFYYYRAAAAN